MTDSVEFGGYSDGRSGWGCRTSTLRQAIVSREYIGAITLPFIVVLGVGDYAAYPEAVCLFFTKSFG